MTMPPRRNAAGVALLVPLLAVVLGGCSFLFDVDRFDRGGATARDGGTDDDEDAEAEGHCDDVEPNDTSASARPLPTGTKCGTLSSASDRDWYAFEGAGPTTLTFEFPSGVGARIQHSGGTANVTSTKQTMTINAATGRIEVFSNGGTGAYRITRH